MSLAGKTAIVTGGSTGIGAAVALALSRARVNVVVCERRIAPLAEVVAQIGAAEGSAEGSALYVQADVAREEDVALWLLTRRLNNKIGRPLLIQTMENPWR